MKILAERDALKQEVAVLRNSREKTSTNELIADYCELVRMHLEEHRRILKRDMDELERMEAEFKAVRVSDAEEGER